MRIVKRIICALLAVSCVFFTGCNSIIYNGDFSFQSFPPETIPYVGNLLPTQFLDIQENQEMEKYNIEGRNAFYILPLHDCRPDKILDFKVLDYTDDGRFIYAYLTPYYGTAAGNGLQQAAKEGVRREYRDYSSLDGTNTMNVLVLMSYDPQRLLYKVFYSHTVDAAASEMVTNKEAESELGALQASINNSTVMANRLVKDNAYFIFDNQTAYVYDQNGKEIQHTSYASVIAQEASRLKEQARTEHLKTKAADVVDKMIENATVSVSDVVMDGYYFVYIPLTVEVEEPGKSSSENSDVDDLDDEFGEEEEEMANTVYSTVISCFDLDIGGKNSTVEFTSKNQVWEQQKKYWKTFQKSGNESLFVEGSDVFVDKDAMETYKAKYTMEQIKLGKVGNIPDKFPVFRTESSLLNMELAGIGDLSNFQLHVISSNNKDKGAWNGKMWELAAATDFSMRDFWQYYGWYIYFIAPTYNEIFWTNRYGFTEEAREMSANAVKETLTLLAQGDPTAVKRTRDNTSLGSKMADGDYLLIPWLTPGTWNEKEKKNAMPYTQSNTAMVEALFAYKTSVYTGGLGAVSRYANIEFKDRYQSQDKQPKLQMEVVEKSKANEVTRSFKYQVTEKDKEGKDVTREESGGEEKLSSYPIKYRLIFPEGTEITWIESVDSGEMVTASRDMGAVFYMEKTQGDASNGEKATSSIRYNDGGTTDLLSDQNVTGSAMDAAMLYHSGKEIIAFITDDRICFYNKSGSGGKCAKKLDLP